MKHRGPLLNKERQRVTPEGGVVEGWGIKCVSMLAYPMYICVSGTEVLANKHNDWSPMAVHTTAVQAPQGSDVCQVFQSSFSQ